MMVSLIWQILRYLRAFVCLLGRLANVRAKSSGTHSCVSKTIGLLMFALLLLYVLISVIAVAVKSEAHIT